MKVHTKEMTMQQDSPEQPVQEPQVPEAPAYSPTQPVVADAPVKKKGLKLPILLMAAPIILIVGSILLYAVVNLITASAEPAASNGSDSDLFGETAPNPARTITNVVLFLVGAFGVLGFLPCMIIGLILLIQRLQK
jgi:hypothetical protein